MRSQRHILAAIANNWFWVPMTSINKTCKLFPSWQKEMNSNFLKNRHDFRLTQIRKINSKSYSSRIIIFQLNSVHILFWLWQWFWCSCEETKVRNMQMEAKVLSADVLEYIHISLLEWELSYIVRHAGQKAIILLSKEGRLWGGTHNCSVKKYHRLHS